MKFYYVLQTRKRIGERERKRERERRKKDLKI
jgi:hypothetical protein